MSDKNRWRVLVAAIVFGAIANLAGTVLFVVTSTQARRANCDQVRDSLHTLVVELGESFGRGADDPDVIDLDGRVQHEVRECR